MLVRQLEDEVVKAKTQASHTNPEVSFTSSIVTIYFSLKQLEVRIISVTILMKADMKLT